MTISIACRLPTGTVDLAADAWTTVQKLKEALSSKRKGAEAMRLISAGKELDDAATLEQCQLRDGSAVYLVEQGSQSASKISVKTLKDRVFNILIDGSTDVAELKRRVEEQDSQWEVQRQRLIFQGRELRDQDLLSQCGLDETNPSVHLVMRLPQPGTTKRWKHKDEAATVAKPTRYTRSTVKIETDEESLESAYETLGDCSGRLDLNDVLDECSLPMELDQAWKEFSEEPALQSTGWESPMASMDDSMAGVDLACSPTAHAPIGNTMMALMVHTDAASASPASTPSSKAAKHETLAEVNAAACPSTQGRAYDLTKVDDKLRKRLLKNRLSAERSRQRKQAHVETLEFELSCCRSENEALKKRVALLEAQLSQFNLGSSQQGAVAMRPEIAVQ